MSGSARIVRFVCGAMFCVTTALVVIDGFFTTPDSLGPIRRNMPSITSRGMGRGGSLELAWSMTAIAYVVSLWIAGKMGGRKTPAWRIATRAVFSAVVLATVGTLLYFFLYSIGMSH